MSVGERLKYSREVAGLTLKQVVARSGIGESSLSEFENAKREPRLGQLQKLAKVYRRSISFFFEEGEITREVVLWRERPEPETSAEIEAEFLKLSRQYHNLETWCDEHRSCELPEAKGSAASFGYREAERLAYQVRAELRLGDRPGQSLMTVLEEVCGVKIFHLSFDPSGTAAGVVSEAFGPAVLLNAKNGRRRRNFDLAHELFHLLTWRIFRLSGGGEAAEASEQEEKYATCFASHLLMPSDVTRLAINDASQGGTIGLDGLSKIARQFDVSVEALLWRMHFLYSGRNEEETKKDIARYRMMGVAWEDRERDEPPHRPARFVALARQALRQGQISQGKLAEYLGISRREAMEIAEDLQVALDQFAEIAVDSDGQ